MQAMLATQLNEKTKSPLDQSFSSKHMVRVASFSQTHQLTSETDIRFINVLALRVLVHSVEKIGDPQQINFSSDNAMTTPGVNVASTSTIPPAPPVQVSQAPHPISRARRGTIFPIDEQLLLSTTFILG